MLLEEIIKKELKKLVEAKDATAPKEAKGKLATQLNEFAAIHSQIQKLESELNKLKKDPKYVDSKDKITQIMEELKETGHDTMETKKFVVKMTRKSSVGETASYSKILEEFLPKVSIKLREVYSKIKESHTSQVKKGASFDVKNKETDVKESSTSAPSLSGVLSGVKSIHSMITRLKNKFS
jgi:hypothetical protein